MVHGINRPGPVERTSGDRRLGNRLGDDAPEEGGDEQAALESAGEGP
jgi:hypothetical protein